MKIAIIGGSGFVGTHLMTHLIKSTTHNILNIDKQKSKQFQELTCISDVTDKEKLKILLEGVEVVVLLAAEHRDDVTPTSLYYDINVQGMKNTLEAMDVNGVKRIVFTSSVAVYGLNKVNPNENTPVDLFNHYGKSKWQAEQVLLNWHKSHTDWNINIIRPTVIFGEGNRGNVYNLLNQIATGRFMMIGSGNNAKSMSYVGNIVAFITYLITSRKTGYEVYNYVDKPDLTTNDLVHHTGETMGKKIPTIRIPYFLGMLGGYGFDILAWVLRKKLTISSIRIKKFCAVTQYDSSKAMSSGFVPPYSMLTGLKRTLEAEFKSPKK